MSTQSRHRPFFRHATFRRAENVLIEAVLRGAILDHEARVNDLVGNWVSSGSRSRIELNGRLDEYIW